MNLIKLKVSCGSNPFSFVYSFGSVNSNSSTKYYALDNNVLRICKFDENWNFLNQTAVVAFYPKFMLTINKNNSNLIFITTNQGISKVNEDMKEINKTAIILGYQGLYYNNSTDHILVSMTSFTRIDVYSLSLDLINSITVPYSSYNMVEYDGLLFVSSNISYVMVLKNETYIYSFATRCSIIRTLVIDQYGVIAVNCFGNYLALYNLNGTYTGTTFYSPVQYIYSFGFDALKNLILITKNGLYAMSPEKANVTNENVTKLNFQDNCYSAQSE